MDVITYPCWDWSWAMLVKGATGLKQFYLTKAEMMYTVSEWLNDVKNVFQLDSYLLKIFNHFKLRYTDPCNFLNKRAIVSQPSTLVFAKDSHHLNSSIYLPTITIVIV